MMVLHEGQPVARGTGSACQCELWIEGNMLLIYRKRVPIAHPKLDCAVTATDYRSWGFLLLKCKHNQAG